MLVGGVYPSARGLCFLQLCLCLSGPPRARKPKEAGTLVAPAALGYMTHTGTKDLHGDLGLRGGRCPQIRVPHVHPLGSRVLQCNGHGTPAQRLCGPAGRVDDRQGQPLRSQGLRSVQAAAVNRRSPSVALPKNSASHDFTIARDTETSVGGRSGPNHSTLTLAVISFIVFWKRTVYFSEVGGAEIYGRVTKRKTLTIIHTCMQY